MENANHELPGEPETSITTELLEEAVRREKGTDDVVVLDFKTKAGTKRGDNYLSYIAVAEVKAKVRGEIETCNYIVKELPADPARKQFLENGNVFQREIEVYGTIIPALMDVQKQYGVKNPIVVEAPKMYSSTKNTNWIVFENLKIQGYRMTTKFNGLDYNHCRLALNELGKYHALSYALRLNTKKDLEEEYSCLEDQMFSKAGEELFRDLMNSSYKMAIRTIGMVDATLAEKMKPLEGNVYQKCRDIRNDTEGLEVIGHGDFWVNNVMFKYEKKGDIEVPVAVKMLDFQISRVASPTMDLLYFFSINTTRQMRLKHLRDLLKSYHDTFTNALHSMGLEFEEFTYQRLCDKYEKDRLFGYYFGCFFLALMMANPDDTYKVDEIPGMQETLITHEILSKMHEKHDYLDRLKGLAQDLYESPLI